MVHGRESNSTLRLIHIGVFHGLVPMPFSPKQKWIFNFKIEIFEQNVQTQTEKS